MYGTYCVGIKTIRHSEDAIASVESKEKKTIAYLDSLLWLRSATVEVIERSRNADFDDLL